MFIIQITTNIALFVCGVFGILSNRGNILIVLMCVEIILLSVNLNFIIFSIYLDDCLGQILSLFILTIAAAESAIGLAILILYYRIKSKILIEELILLKN